ncbi:MAPEG family protein [Luteimonas sp. A277]
MSPTQHLFAACLAMVALTFVVGLHMFRIRVGEMMARRIHPQSVALSGQRAQRLEDSRASDNFSHLFEVPVLFYLLCAVAIGTGHVPVWLPALAWLFVLSRIVHSAIQCSYNKVMHRFVVFLVSFFLLLAMWAMYAVSFLAL